jgi:hypothetical protein
MWLGIENAIRRVADTNGRLFIAVYNDEGWKSHVWWLVKSFYNQLPRFFRAPFVAVVTTVTHLLVIMKYTIKLRPTGKPSSIFQLQHALRLRVMTNQVEHKVKVKMGKTRKAAQSFVLRLHGVNSE